MIGFSTTTASWKGNTVSEWKAYKTWGRDWDSMKGSQKLTKKSRGKNKWPTKTLMIKCVNRFKKENKM